MDRTLNPYRPGAGTNPPALVGRDSLIDEFGVDLRRTVLRKPGKHMMLVGLRGVGKTVLLNRFAGIATDEGIKVASVEPSESVEFRYRIAVQMRTILLQLSQGPGRRLARRALSVLKSFTLNLPDGSAIALNVDALLGQADSGLLELDLTDLLLATGEAAAAQKSGLVLSVDEAQYLKKSELSALIAAIHRSNQLDLPILLVGAALPQIRRLAGDAKPYSERLFKFPEINSLAPDEASDVITLPACEHGVEFEDGALSLIVRKSRRYPYFLQEWGHHTWNAAPASPVTAADAESVSADVVATLDRDFFRVRLDRVTPKEREYLRAIAELGPGPHRSAEIAEQLGVKPKSVSPRRSDLITKGMIYSPAHGETAFTVPLFDEFLKRAG